MPRQMKQRHLEKTTRGTPVRKSRQRNNHNESFDDDEVYGSGSTSAESSYTSMASMEMASGRRKYDDYRPGDEEDEEEIYVVRQDHGYFAVLFSLVQTVILSIMMWQCGIAPMQLK